ncbi:MAG: hypothetical protein ABW321_25280 [Polyangiales bacterium]
MGTQEDCNAECVIMEITEHKGGDGCCPQGANAADDPDCPKSCGDGIVDDDETCELMSADKPCPTSCDDGEACTQDMPVGRAEQCTAACVHTPITTRRSGDQCCPDGANPDNDRDCETRCGDGAVTGDETCDPQSSRPCPTSCEQRECMEGKVAGNAASCSAYCAYTQITNPQNNDGCCPANANAATDNDCAPECGNNVVEAGEECDIGARSTGGDGLPPGTEYTEWSCNDASCDRRYDLTPCSANTQCGDGACAQQAYCAPRCEAGVPMMPSQDACNVPNSPCWNCEMQGGKRGICIAGGCLPRCNADSDCPEGLLCKAFDRFGSFMICDVFKTLSDPEPWPDMP